MPAGEDDDPARAYEPGQDNIRLFGLDVHNPVFIIAAIAIVLFVFVALIFQQNAAAAFTGMRKWLTTRFDWWFMIAGNGFVLFCLTLIVTPLGRIRLGGKDARPDYSYAGWFAMLFAAGMGIGLMFFGVLEPLNHFRDPPLGVDSTDKAAAMRAAMSATIFHWGLHAWAIYAAVALALAYFHFNRGLPLTLRSAFFPLLGKRIWGWPGHIVDVLAIFATLFGLATSLGLGAGQANAGLHYLFGTPVTDASKVLLIVGITALATLSVVAGLDAGIKLLSTINMWLALGLMLFVIVAGPTAFILKSLAANSLHYLEDLPALSNWIGRSDQKFLHGWTTFYWAWWISWSPFVGMFIARISRGRTVREFVFYVLIVPTAISILWMSTFGGAAIHQYADGGYMGVAETIKTWKPELALFKMLDQLPLTQISSTIGIVLVVVFFVTSSDSASLVVDTIAAGGKIDTPVAQRVFWCAFQGLVAIVLLLGGGLGALQAMAIATGFPFALVLVLMCVATLKSLSDESRNASR
ncbi:MAG: BCCT family transporter [Beijerinckiaceae bacterium]